MAIVVSYTDVSSRFVPSWYRSMLEKERYFTLENALTPIENDYDAMHPVRTCAAATHFIQRDACKDGTQIGSWTHSRYTAFIYVRMTTILLESDLGEFFI